MILLLGGTSDSIELACELYKLTADVLLSTATEYGSHIYSERFEGSVVSGRKDREQLAAFIKEKSVTLLVDATHPYAANVSRNAIEACAETGMAYIRYERGVSELYGENVLLCDSYEEAGEIADKLTGNIFITTGSNNIEKIVEKISDRKRIRARILPVSESVLKLERLGLNGDNIIAMKGPFSQKMNSLMLTESKAAVMICKDSGERGGTMEKLAAAQRLGIKILLIKRPAIDYPNKFGSISELLQYISENRELWR